jgi:hypothetical protein
MKKEHPGKLVAMQIGDFLELAGWDAVLAIEAIGLNGMGLGVPFLHAILCCRCVVDNLQIVCSIISAIAPNTLFFCVALHSVEIKNKNH